MQFFCIIQLGKKVRYFLMLAKVGGGWLSKANISIGGFYERQEIYFSENLVGCNACDLFALLYQL